MIRGLARARQTLPSSLSSGDLQAMGNTRRGDEATCRPCRGLGLMVASCFPPSPPIRWPNAPPAPSANPHHTHTTSPTSHRHTTLEYIRGGRRKGQSKWGRGDSEARGDISWCQACTSGAHCAQHWLTHVQSRHSSLKATVVRRAQERCVPSKPGGASPRGSPSKWHSCEHASRQT